VISEYNSRLRSGNADLAGDMLWVEVFHGICILCCAFRARSLVSSSWMRRSDGDQDSGARCTLGYAAVVIVGSVTELCTFEAHRTWKSVGGSDMYMPMLILASRCLGIRKNRGALIVEKLQLR
jgi:hypothetical protein